MRFRLLIARRKRNLESALRAAICSAGNGAESTISPEGRRSVCAIDIETRQQSRGKQCTDALDVGEPRPRLMTLDRLSECCCSFGLTADCTRVGVLENARGADAFAARDCLDQRVCVFGRGVALGERSSLEDCPQPLTVRNARSLR